MYFEKKRLNTLLRKMDNLKMILFILFYQILLIFYYFIILDLLPHLILFRGVAQLLSTSMADFLGFWHIVKCKKTARCKYSNTLHLKKNPFSKLKR